MEIDPRLLQFGGSLAAILAVSWLVLALKLGPKPHFENEAQARHAASEVVDGFVAAMVTLDARGRAALLQDEAGRVMLLKTHGSHFAGRILSASASAARSEAQIVIDSGEARFGSVALELADPGVWAKAINRLEHA